jgi:hypothetical protein
VGHRHHELILQRVGVFGVAPRRLFALEQNAQLLVGLLQTLGLGLTRQQQFASAAAFASIWRNSTKRTPVTMTDTMV